jgi:hypothetical protein
VKINSQLKQNRMKQLKLILVGLVFVLSGTIHGQVSVDLHLGNPPAWGPAESPNSRYYYLPDIQMYYDRSSSNYIYLSHGRWLHTRDVPPAYRNYDFYGAYKVSLNDYHGERPYEHYNEHRKSYPSGYNRGHEQKTFGERPRGNSEHKDDGHDRK